MSVTRVLIFTAAALAELVRASGWASVRVPKWPMHLPSYESLATAVSVAANGGIRNGHGAWAFFALPGFFWYRWSGHFPRHSAKIVVAKPQVLGNINHMSVTRVLIFTAAALAELVRASGWASVRVPKWPMHLPSYESLATAVSVAANGGIRNGHGAWAFFAFPGFFWYRWRCRLLGWIWSRHKGWSQRHGNASNAAIPASAPISGRQCFSSPRFALPVRHL